MSRVVLVPGALALLPEYAGLVDPVAELRAACLAAVSWLGDDVVVLGDAQGVRVGEALLAACGASRLAPLAPRPAEGSASVVEEVAQQPSRDPVSGAGPGPGPAYLVVGNGSACRSEKAPGHLDQRSFAFDEALGAALVAPDPGALAGVDPVLAADLWASVEGLAALGGLLTPEHVATTDFAGDPFGVQYWVIRWSST